MKTEAEKKIEREVSNPNSEKITLSAADLAKKPIGVRRKSTKTPEKEAEDLKYKGGRVSKYAGLKDSKLTEENKSVEKEFTQLPWKRQSNVWSKNEVEHTFGPPPKTNKILKQRRSASQKNMSSESFGEQGKLMLEALRIPENNRSLYDVTHGFHPYPGRFHPDLPKILLKQFPAGSIVFDPCMGGGTVLLEGLLWQHQVFGNDLSPVAKMVAKERCRWISEKNAGRVWQSFENVSERVKARSFEKRS
ncbi:MAG: hypothetical protein VYA87_09440, partial [SAR324 cluster bacterium]|nr:hypothetical protein [SAR324 cluster bacterium]